MLKCVNVCSHRKIKRQITARFTGDYGNVAAQYGTWILSPFCCQFWEDIPIFLDNSRTLGLAYELDNRQIVVRFLVGARNTIPLQSARTVYGVHAAPISMVILEYFLAGKATTISNVSN